MADEIRSGPGPQRSFLDDFSNQFRNKLAGPSYFDGAAELVSRLLNKPSASQNLAAWEYNKTPPMPNEGQTNMLGKLLGMVPENAMFAANFLGPGVKPQIPAPKPQGIRAYHGSPHDFDQFSLAHIGKGEGAQAFGHGLYFAEREGVAKSYRDKLQKITIDGAPWSSRNPEHLAAAAVDFSKGDLAKAKDYHRDNMNFEGHSPELRKLHQEALAILETKGAPSLKKESGKMYEVNINANPEHFMDLDAPIAKQPEAVRRVIESELASGSPDPTRDKFRELLGQPKVPAPDLTAMTPLDYLRSRIRPGRLEDALRAEGVPGAKYLDQGSRTAGEGSRNYVVFDDKLIEILRKYGLMPPAVAAGAAALGQGDNQQ